MLPRCEEVDWVCTTAAADRDIFPKKVYAIEEKKNNSINE